MTFARPSLVIFDCDGVLIDSEVPANRVLAEALCQIGLATTASDCHARYTGLSYRDCLSDIETRLGKALPEDWLAALRARTHGVLEQEVTPIPHALDVVLQLYRAGMPLCVASSSNVEYLEKFLTKTGFIEFFDGRLFSSRMVASGKPAPDLFLYAAAQMGVDPKRSVVIEDSLPGVRAAVAAGMRVIAYAGNEFGDPAALAAAGAELIADMRQVPAMLAVA